MYARILLLVLLFQIFGIFIFNEGFFLTRIELDSKSSCKEIPLYRKHQLNKSHCWLDEAHGFKRAIVIVIDALRYDFAEWDPEMQHSQRPFENKLAVVRDALLLKPLHSLLVPFVADPPTTTMQRLKGMMTGGLPTFLEIKDDVAATEITEDNFIQLLFTSGRNITFMGDDTWTDLFPNQFNRAFPYPSFNVKDLDTVDNGVMEHLLPEMKRDHWDIIIGHFLGVDHCGHRFGPDSPDMQRKLLEMNHAIDTVIQELDSGKYNDTLLLVFGDHGMTHDGNHGGALPEEVEAALFVYAPQPILLGGHDIFDEKMKNYDKLKLDFEEETKLLHPDSRWSPEGHDDSTWLLKRRPKVDQIDLAPTLALLLGLPIPFGSLGKIIPELFFSTTRETEGQKQEWLARYRALNQAMEVNVAQVVRYLSSYNKIAGNILGKILKDLDERARIIYRQLEQAEEDMQFEEGSSTRLLRAHQLAYNQAIQILDEASNAGRELWTSFNLTKMATGIACLCASSFVLCYELWKRLDRSEEHMDQILVSLAFCSILLGTRLSNSYIVAEPRVNALVTTSFIGYLTGKTIVGVSTRMSLILLGVSMACCSRICVDLPPFQWYRGQEAVSGDFYMPWFWINCCIPLAGIAVSLYLLSGGSWTPLLQALCAGMHWCFQSLGSAGLKTTPPRIVFGIAIIGISYVFLKIRTFPNARVIFTTQLVIYSVIPLAMVIGPASPLPILLMIVQIFGTYRLMQSGKLSYISIGVLWLMLANTYFYATGHETFFNKLHYAAPFVGFDHHDYYRGAVMIGYNTFGFHILFCFALPLLILKISSSEVNARIAQLSLLLIQSLLGLVTVVFVAAQRRHLMVWAIFAPKYIFDAGTMVIVQFSSFIVSCIIVYNK